ncbi:hypothetical protein IQ264_32120 [Phormidium sp. LEGE 05292]|uniref:hypothetical protein n=1 Tax=[Phormidium] sp. LEGE 05292 TaxID=767427 RepID=UPI00187E7159|nr:hypothetical protein [Phormidium sp. LEGE 05292]MBE9230050.1 hypothetical protein [Phormidium sp. LEGE 05292]
MLSLLFLLTELEDMALGKLAEAVLSQLSMVGTETFVESLKQLAIFLPNFDVC